MENLYLRNLDNEYFPLTSKGKNVVYHDPANDNLIVFSPHDNNDVESVCNCIRECAYNYLINELNNKENVIVSWSQVEGTTSDYSIYYDFNVGNFINKSYKEIIKTLSKTGQRIGMKYTEIINNQTKPIRFKEEQYN